MKEAMSKTPDFLLFVIPNELTDGSVVYDVRFGEHVFHAITQGEAGELAERIAEAINDHTNNTADVVYE